jgi:hypothetical protein
MTKGPRRTFSVPVEPVEELRSELLVLFCHSDERPLRGAAGRVDWRLCGQLSALMVEGELTGALGECLLVPVQDRRMGASRVLMLGVGEGASSPRSQLRAGLEQALEVLAKLRLKGLLLAFPESWLVPEIAPELARILVRRVESGLKELEDPITIKLKTNRESRMRFRDALRRELRGIPNFTLDSPPSSPNSGLMPRKSAGKTLSMHSSS